MLTDVGNLKYQRKSRETGMRRASLDQSTGVTEDSRPEWKSRRLSHQPMTAPSASHAQRQTGMSSLRSVPSIATHGGRRRSPSKQGPVLYKMACSWITLETL